LCGSVVPAAATSVKASWLRRRRSSKRKPSASPTSRARARRRERDALKRASEDLKLQTEMAAAITDLYPGCPSERAQAIARHAATRGSGRVGRSTAGRALQLQALQLAVTASVRHQDTLYDGLLMSGIDRSEARERVRDTVNSVLDAWRSS
jgi:hypothetical protein